MPSLESLTGFVTVPSATFTALTMSNGSLTIRDFNQGRAFLLDVVRNGQATGAVRIRSPKLHDFVNGIRLQGQIDTTLGAQSLLPFGFPQILTAQDTLIVEDTGSAVAADIENVSLLVYQEMPTGPSARLIGFDELERRIVNVTTLSHALVGAVTGAYGAVQSLAAGVADTLKANTDYALLGLSFSESAIGNALGVGIQGPDLGNYLVNIPLLQGGRQSNQEYFLDLTRKYKVGLIPVINSANKGGTFLSVLNNENANTVTVTTIWAQLA